MTVPRTTDFTGLSPLDNKTPDFSGVDLPPVVARTVERAAKPVLMRLTESPSTRGVSGPTAASALGTSPLLREYYIEDENKNLFLLKVRTTSDDETAYHGAKKDDWETIENAIKAINREDNFGKGILDPNGGTKFISVKHSGADSTLYIDSQEKGPINHERGIAFTDALSKVVKNGEKFGVEVKTATSTTDASAGTGKGVMSSIASAAPPGIGNTPKTPSSNKPIVPREHPDNTSNVTASAKRKAPHPPSPTPNELSKDSQHVELANIKVSRNTDEDLSRRSSDSLNSLPSGLPYKLHDSLRTTSFEEDRLQASQTEPKASLTTKDSSDLGRIPPVTRNPLNRQSPVLKKDDSGSDEEDPKKLNPPHFFSSKDPLPKPSFHFGQTQPRNPSDDGFDFISAQANPPSPPISRQPPARVFKSSSQKTGSKDDLKTSSFKEQPVKRPNNPSKTLVTPELKTESDELLFGTKKEEGVWGLDAHEGKVGSTIRGIAKKTTKFLQTFSQPFSMDKSPESESSDPTQKIVEPTIPRRGTTGLFSSNQETSNQSKIERLTDPKQHARLHPTFREVERARGSEPVSPSIGKDSAKIPSLSSTVKRKDTPLSSQSSIQDEQFKAAIKDLYTYYHISVSVYDKLLNKSEPLTEDQIKQLKRIYNDTEEEIKALLEKELVRAKLEITPERLVKINQASEDILREKTRVRETISQIFKEHKVDPLLLED